MTPKEVLLDEGFRVHDEGTRDEHYYYEVRVSHYGYACRELVATVEAESPYLKRGWVTSVHFSRSDNCEDLKLVAKALEEIEDLMDRVHKRAPEVTERHFL